MADDTVPAGQAAYEQDLIEHPKYHDGTPRKTWDELDILSQWSWNRRNTGVMV